MDDDFLAALQALVSESSILIGEDISKHYTDPWSKGLTNKPLCVLRPTSTIDVSNILKICNDRKCGVVPQGGMTGLVGGGIPKTDEVVLSLERMNVIEHVDRFGKTMTAQAGVVLETANTSAELQGLTMPVDLGARGSATLGGLISTNAGGNRVIRNGMMRQSVLGIEAVLADGTVLESMNTMLKNNAGYDTKQMFIGSEGTLGIITRCVLRLQPKPQSISTAFVGAESFDQVLDFLVFLDDELSGGLGAFEVMWPNYYQFVKSTCPKLKLPLSDKHQFYILFESLSSNSGLQSNYFETLLENAVTQGLIDDGVIAQSLSDRNDFWAIREGVSEGFRTLSPIFTYDVSMPLKTMNYFANQLEKEMTSFSSSAVALVFGHLGDGNLHVVVSTGDGSDLEHNKINDIIYGIVSRLNGSVSAEHGIGTEKLNYLSWSKTAEELEVMKSLKRSFDPNLILNPGKVLCLDT